MPNKLSRSKIELFIDCPRCFWLEMKKRVKRPQPAPYTINNAVDYLLKQEFDVYREKGEPHPLMAENKMDAVPYQTSELNKWRHNFTGVQHHHQPTDFLVCGAVDDVWIDSGGKLIVVDYKATGANQHQIYDSYKRQMEIYQWLLRRNGYEVSPTGYFVFARVNKANGFAVPAEASREGGAMGNLSFDLFLESYEGNDSWVENALLNARDVLDSEEIPESSSDCEYCQYRESR